MRSDQGAYDVAFVLGGGGILGAHEVGMLRALAESSIQPDVILGTSIGAVNGAMFAGDPTVGGVMRLGELWRDSNVAGMSAGALLRRVTTLARTGTHLQPLDEVRRRLSQALPVDLVEELAVPFQCVAASIERAAEHWFDSGVLTDVVLASCAVPGILPPVAIGDEHFIDGGIVNSIPVARAVALASGRPITEEHIFQRSRVLYMTLEDDLRFAGRSTGDAPSASPLAVGGWVGGV